MEMASLSRGMSFRRQGSSGMSWTDTWTFNEEGELVRKPKEEHGQVQRFAGSSLSRIHDSTIIHDDDQIPEDQQTPSSSSTLERSKSVGSKSVLGSSHVLPRYHKPSPSIFRWIKKTLLKLKKSSPQAHLHMDQKTSSQNEVMKDAITSVTPHKMKK